MVIEGTQENLKQKLGFIDFIDFPLEFMNAFNWIFGQCRRSKGKEGYIVIEKGHIPAKSNEKTVGLREKEEASKRKRFLQKMIELCAIKSSNRIYSVKRDRVFELNRQISYERDNKILCHLKILQERILSTHRLTKIFKEHLVKYEAMKKYDMRVATAVYLKEFNQLKFRLEDLEFEINEFGSFESLIAEYKILRAWMNLDERAKASLRRFCA
ncbi:MAG: hypothetical protein L3J07_03810 [Candidatus Magasanikbacteria bacterium]|nr:hypothetical protein [Candidatus Magasanikbacteria bacterium]